MTRRTIVMSGLVVMMMGMWFGLSACVVTPSLLCERTLYLTCEKFHECISADNKKTELFKAQFGESVAECVEMRTKGSSKKAGILTINIPAAKCSEKTETSYCTDSKRPVYHPEKADACLQAWNEVSCADVTKKLFSQPTVCNEICQAS